MSRRLILLCAALIFLAIILSYKLIYHELVMCQMLPFCYCKQTVTLKCIKSQYDKAHCKIRAANLQEF